MVYSRGLNKTMRKTGLILTAVMLGMTLMTPKAEETTETAGIILDFNKDGATDRTDWEELREFVRTYQMETEERTPFSKQEVPATINLLINDQYGSRQKTGYDINVDGISEYYLPSIGMSTTVKNQNPFGTCWAFGTIASIESNLLLKRSGQAGTVNPEAEKLDLSKASAEPDLSELYHAYINYTTAKGLQEGEGTVSLYETDNANFLPGGFPSSSQQLLSAWRGPITEEMEPYEPVRADEEGAQIYELRDEAADEAAVPAAHVQKYIYLNSPAILKPDLERRMYVWQGYDPQAVETMKQAIVKYGALMIAYGADTSQPGESGDGSFFNYDHWAQYDDREEMELNHMVSVVGWNDSYPKENFKAAENELPPGDGAFLVKNSWGNYDQYYQRNGERLTQLLEEYKGTEYEKQINRMYNYGIPDKSGHGSGYFWLSYYDHSIISVSALDADDASDGFDYDHNYQYDLARQIAVEAVSLPTEGEETKTANVFTAEGREELRAVSVYAPQAECEAKIRVIGLTDGESNLSSGTVLAEQSVSLSEKGFHTVELEQPVLLDAGMRFAVEEKVVSEHEDRTIAWLNLEHIIRPDLQTDDNLGLTRTAVVANPGETYAYVRNGDGYVWTDIETLNSETDASMVFEFGNAYIKAYTNDVHLTGPDTAAPAQPANRIPLYIFFGAILAAIIYLMIKNRETA